MTTPNFILSLREKIGHDPLWLTGITAYVEDADGRILLGRRRDTGEWALVYGIVEPGEEPGRTCVREVLEETGVHVAPQAIASVKESPRVPLPRAGLPSSRLVLVRASLLLEMRSYSFTRTFSISAIYMVW